MANRRNWLELPAELTESILGRLGAVDLLVSARKVCRSWRRICSDPSMWRIVDLAITEPDHVSRVDTLTRKAVDLSCGQMIDITFHYFVYHKTLLYVSDRSSQLRCLRFVSCIAISNYELSEMVKKLPLLEELHLYRTFISMKVIEAAGNFCPQLKSFTLNNQHYRAHIGCEVEAIAIAKTMHGLRHLNLYGNKIASNGLLAILDNCPHLESLDIRQCLNLANLRPVLGIRRQLFQRIKVLKLPYDPTEAYEFDDGYQKLLHNR